MLQVLAMAAAIGMYCCLKNDKYSLWPSLYLTLTFHLDCFFCEMTCFYSQLKLSQNLGPPCCHFVTSEVSLPLEKTGLQICLYLQRVYELHKTESTCRQAFKWALLFLFFLLFPTFLISSFFSLLYHENALLSLLFHYTWKPEIFLRLLRFYKFTSMFI